jgi:hypothetical protein
MNVNEVNGMKVLKILLVLIFILSFVAVPVLAATDKDGSDTNGAYQQRLNDGSSNDDKITADKIYSDDKVLGFTKGDGSITKKVNPNESMKVMSSFNTVWAITILGILIGIGLVILGYFGSVIGNALKMVYAMLFTDNPDEAMHTVQTRKKSTRMITMALGESLIIISIVSFFVFNSW